MGERGMRVSGERDTTTTTSTIGYRRLHTFGYLSPTSPSASPALPDQSSASMVVRQDDFSTVVAAADLIDATPGIALSQQVASLTVSALPMSAAVSGIVPEPTDVEEGDVESAAPGGNGNGKSYLARKNRRKKDAKQQQKSLPG